MIERKAGAVLIEGPQGTGKTSLTAEVPRHFPNIKTARGIPDNSYLINHREAEIWRETLKIFNEGQDDCRVFDRSILSLVAYNLRKYPQAETLIFGLGLSYLNRIHQATPNILLLFIDAEVEKCLERQPVTRSGFKIHSPVEMKAEVEIYQRLANWLIGEGFMVERLQNNASWEQFLEQACLAINHFWKGNRNGD